jgi:hypothetical protein
LKINGETKKKGDVYLIFYIQAGLRVDNISPGAVKAVMIRKLL